MDIATILTRPFHHCPLGGISDVLVENIHFGDDRPKNRWHGIFIKSSRLMVWGCLIYNRVECFGMVVKLPYNDLRIKSLVQARAVLHPT